ncbi:MAG: DUF1292 domain-containing protein [Alphaproteobacteria bacterium]|nr:DUF1292 domain-containing protein [Alphaproteobacteria bacterium]
MAGPDETEIDVFTLTDEDGNEADYGFLLLVELEEGRFAVLAPLDQLEGDDDGSDDPDGPGLDLYAFAYVEEDDGVRLDEVESDDLLDRIFEVAEKALFEGGDEE